MKSSKSLVQIGVDRSFFTNVFEPSRKKAEESLGIKVSQRDFTRMIKESGMKLDINFRGLNCGNSKRKKR